MALSDFEIKAQESILQKIKDRDEKGHLLLMNRAILIRGAIEKREDAQHSGKKVTLREFSLLAVEGLKEIISLDQDQSDLTTFSDKLTSLKVTGTCCWKIYTEINFQGDSMVFKEGEVQNAVKLGPVFREAKSVKRLINC